MGHGTGDLAPVSDLAPLLVAIAAGDRRTAVDLVDAVIGEPGSPRWNPPRQRAVILYLIEAGADPDATAAGGVTILAQS